MSGTRIVLTGVSANVQGRRWESDKLLRVGRLDTLEVVLNDTSVSRRHAEIVLASHGWGVRDLGSTNGTVLNGTVVDGTLRKLALKDVLQFGDVALQVTALDAAAQGELRPADTVMRTRRKDHKSWQEALDGIKVNEDQASREHLLTLLRAGYHLRYAESLDRLLQSILEDAASVLHARHGCILLADRHGKLHLRAAVAAEDTGPATPWYSQTLAGQAFERGESVLWRQGSDSGEVYASSGSVQTMSSIVCAVLRSPRKKLGVLHLDRAMFQPAFSEHDYYLADGIAASVSAAIEVSQLVEAQRNLFLQTVTALARTVELRDQYTGNHIQRVTDYAMLLAKSLNFTPAEQLEIQMGAPLHDIGKIGIDDAVLRKPGRLTPEEFEHMKTHTTKGAEVIETIPDLAAVLPIVRNHHERWDGTGYPDGLKGERIPRIARVVGLADALDAMTSARPYRPAMTMDAAFAEITSKSGIHFEPACVEALLDLRPRIVSLPTCEQLVISELDRPELKVSRTDPPRRTVLRP